MRRGIALLSAVWIVACLDVDNVKVSRVERSPGETATSCACAAPYINVKSAAFGAVGDGNHDDTAAIQAAIDSLAETRRLGVESAAPGGGTVYLPPGNYRVTAPILIESARGHQNLTLLGAGPNATQIVDTSTDGGTTLVARGTEGDSVRGLSIREITIAGNPRSGTGIELIRTIRQVTFDRVFVRNPGGDGIAIGDVSNRITLNDCRIERERGLSGWRNPGVGLRLSANAEQIWAYGTSIRGFGTGVRVGSYSNVVDLYGGDIHGNAVGFLVSGADRDDGRVSTVEVRGVYFEENGRDVVVTNDGERFRAANITIAGNSFSKTTGLDGTYATGAKLSQPTYSVYLDRAEHCTVETNEFRKTTAPHLTAAVGLGAASRDNRVSDNFIPRDGVEKSTVASVRNDGHDNWGNIIPEEPSAFVHQGAAVLRDGVLRFGEHSLWIDSRGALRVTKGTPHDLDRDGHVIHDGGTGE